MTNKLLTPSPITRQSITKPKVSRYGFTYSKSKAKPNLDSQGKSKKKVSLANIKALGK